MIHINDLTDERICESNKSFDEVLENNLLPQMKLTNNGATVEFSVAIFESIAKKFIND